MLALAEAEDLPAHGAAVAGPAATVTAPRDLRDRCDPLDLPLRDELRGEQPYGAPQLDVPVRLNINENPYPPQRRGRRARSRRRSPPRRATLNRYPDRDALALRADLAAYLDRRRRAGLGGDNVWAANGSNEVMQQLLQAFGGPGRTALSFAPTYSMYPEYARDTHTRVGGRRRAATDFALDLAARPRADRRARSPSVRPAGLAEQPDRHRAAARDDRGGSARPRPGMVVVDEAYAEFRRAGTPSALTLLPRYPRLVVTRTMSKAFALAGGRLGYLAAAPAVVDALRIVRLPYHLSAVTPGGRAGGAGARRRAARRGSTSCAPSGTRPWRWLRAIGPAGRRLRRELRAVRHVRRSARVWQGLLDRGVLIRETGPDGWLRVSIGTPEEMAAFRAALEEVLQ